MRSVSTITKTHYKNRKADSTNLTHQLDENIAFFIFRNNMHWLKILVKRYFPLLGLWNSQSLVLLNDLRVLFKSHFLAKVSPRNYVYVGVENELLPEFRKIRNNTYLCIFLSLPFTFLVQFFLKFSLLLFTFSMLVLFFRNFGGRRAIPVPKIMYKLWKVTKELEGETRGSYENILHFFISTSSIWLLYSINQEGSKLSPYILGFIWITKTWIGNTNHIVKLYNLKK